MKRMLSNIPLIVLMVLTIVLASVAQARVAEPNEGDILYKDAWARFENPDFEDYPVSAEKSSEAASLDLASHPYAQKHAAALKLGYKKSADYAGHYVVIKTDCADVCVPPRAEDDSEYLVIVANGDLKASGCSTKNCNAYWIVDKRNGKIVTVTGVDHDAKYMLNSALFIVNPYEDYMEKKYKEVPTDSSTSFYALKNNEFELVRSICCRESDTKN